MIITCVFFVHRFFILITFNKLYALLCIFENRYTFHRGIWSIDSQSENVLSERYKAPIHLIAKCIKIKPVWRMYISSIVCCVVSVLWPGWGEAGEKLWRQQQGAVAECPALQLSSAVCCCCCSYRYNHGRAPGTQRREPRAAPTLTNNSGENARESGAGDGGNWAHRPGLLESCCLYLPRLQPTAQQQPQQSHE